MRHDHSDTRLLPTLTRSRTPPTPPLINLVPLLVHSASSLTLYLLPDLRYPGESFMPSTGAIWASARGPPRLQPVGTQQGEAFPSYPPEA